MSSINHKKIGMLFAAGAAICYGISGITGKLAYGGGGNTVSILVYRNMISVLLLFLILNARHIPIRVTKKQLAGLAYLGVQGGFLTAMLMYSSFQYISVGLATCTHFCFPVIVACIYVFIFKEKLSRTKTLALLLAFAGVWFFLESNAVVDPKGLALAFASGVSNAIFLTVMDKLGLKSLNGFVISFYGCIFSGTALTIYGLLAGYDLSGGMMPIGWFYVIIGAVLVSALANAMVPTAVRYVGPTVAGIFGILEPVISVLLSVLILHEPFGLRSLLGASLVLSAAVMLTLEKEPEAISEILEEL
ncbi:MAG: DMT family transporter [Eubacteriales bacterium]|jgi:drug/metabolite transporter (DMT)-like permease|nr:DMT family transporter [Eubacteriales bacterium]MDD3289356.1 DMT family transporter [Eubacteriales bacterium]